ncbi:NEBL1_2 [Mytilus coruscus]|uniref:NEBL1_2 n=1 Tax=Mytilus coruscus TaxID=42192 RepID=A0A6J8AWX3_MYTCO|nr:NEBL1_2 [Mytilus coruscus]
MEGLSATENLFEKWMLFSTKNDREKLADFVNCFQETYKHLVDLELTHLNDGYSEEGPHFTVLPDGVLQVFSTQLSQCSELIAHSCDLDTLHFASSIIECLIIITRNYDNVPLVASCEFVKYIVSIASTVISKIKDNSCDIDDICMFVKLVVHFFECLYDPYFVWRKRIKGWSMDKNRMKYKPANLHVEVVPFFFDCFDRGHLSFDLRIRLLHMFGAIMCGSQNNALKVITPATLEVLLKMLSADHVTGPTNELRQELFCIKDLVLKCIICMVHVINLASIDQRQVEVSHVMEDYIKILLKKEDEPQDEQETHIQLAMIGAINEMLSCQDKSSLQVIMVSGGTFDAFISLLQKTALTGSEGQNLAMSVLGVMNSVLSGSVSAKVCRPMSVLVVMNAVLSGSDSAQVCRPMSVLGVMNSVLSGSVRAQVCRPMSVLVVMNAVLSGSVSAKVCRPMSVLVVMNAVLSGSVRAKVCRPMSVLVVMNSVLSGSVRAQVCRPMSVLGVMNSVLSGSVSAKVCRPMSVLVVMNAVLSGSVRAQVCRPMSVLGVMNSVLSGSVSAKVCRPMSVLVVMNAVLSGSVRAQVCRPMSVLVVMNSVLSGSVRAQVCRPMSVLGVMNSVLSGSVSAKERFHLRVGYVKFVEALKSLGQPSIDLLKAVLNLVVETEFDGTKHLVVHNTQAAIMLLHWLPDIQSHDLQMWLSESLGTLCAKTYNKMNCCRDGMISAILQVLERSKQINTKAVGYLIGLLECLGTQSITATELKKLISLLRLDEEENQNPYCSRLMRAMSTMARREGNEGALHFLSLQEHNDCVSLPAGIKKWPGVAFSFHAWLCLDTEVDLTPHNIAGQTYRRQLYSFIASAGCGLESFVTAEFDIVISVFNKKEHSSVLVENTTIGDGHWHCIDIVQSSSRRPFTVSQLNVYFDGKLVQNSQLKFPSMTDPFSSCNIGSPCPKSALVSFADQSDSNTNAEVKKKSPFKFIFPGQSKPSSEPGIRTVPIGTQNEEWGSPIALHGQIGSVCLFHDVITPAQIKTLYTLGPNQMNIFDDEEHTELNDLVNKSVLYYSAKAHKDGVVVDLTGNQHHGHLIGQCCVTWDIKDVINCIGGIQVLFPLLEQVNKSPIPENDEVTILSSPVTISPTDDDWLLIRPSSSYADSKLEQNQAAGFLTLLRHMLHTSSTNRDTFTRTNAAATIGAILQKVNSKLIDVHVLMSAQLLVDMAATTSRTLLQHLYQYILFDFRIWSKSNFPIRIGKKVT